MQIRPATAEDAPAISAIYNDAIVNSTAILWHQPKPVSLWVDRLRDRPARFPILVAQADNAGVIAFAMLGPYDNKCGYDDVAELSLYVQASARGKGVGRALAQAILQAGQSAGLYCVLSRITAGNTVSEHLHHKLGFQRVGVFPQLGHKFGKRYDVIAYQLTF